MIHAVVADAASRAPRHRIAARVDAVETPSARACACVCARARARARVLARARARVRVDSIERTHARTHARTNE
jgi:hypothetical protein